MKTTLQFASRKITLGIAAMALSSLPLLNSCATKYSTEPTTTVPTNTQTVDQFYSPAPNGEADDYYVMNSGDDDVEYSYFIDETDYVRARDADKEHDGDDDHYKFIKEYVKRGHGYGDHNHLHEFNHEHHHYHGVYIGVREIDWTDSLALTAQEKSKIDTAMMAFGQCAKATVDSFKVQMKPYRAEFRARRLAIIAGLDSNKYSRDSARALLDSAIEKYETETELMRKGFAADLAVCRTELDVAIKAILTPDQYAIWTRHRGW